MKMEGTGGDLIEEPWPSFGRKHIHIGSELDFKVGLTFKNKNLGYSKFLKLKVLGSD